MLNISRTSENKHVIYIKKIDKKNKKFPVITIATALKAKKFKMTAEAVEKMQENGKKQQKKNGSCYNFLSPLIQTYLHKHFILK